MPDYQVIEAFLKTLDFISVRSYVRVWITKAVIGFNVTASSCIRKRYTIERLCKIIEEENLPVWIDNQTGDHTDLFRIMLNHEEESPINIEGCAQAGK